MAPRLTLMNGNILSRPFDTELSRRTWLQAVFAGGLGVSMSGWLPLLAADAANHPNRRRACILLWMGGGPSQMDTFDLKPGHANGGPYKSIETSVPGMQISEHLPKLARQAQNMVIVRSMSTKEADHDRGMYLMHTGYRPQGPVHYPTMGSLLSKELKADNSELPGYVSVSPNQFLSPASYSPGFLGPQFAPMVVGGANYGGPRPTDSTYGPPLTVQNLDLPNGVDVSQADNRLKLLHSVDDAFRASRPGTPTASHKSAYEQAVRMMRSQAVSAFKLDEESTALRDAYGKNQFGQGCLLARRLVERGVPFVEVSLNGVQNQQTFGWDTHQNNFDIVKQLSEVLDAAWSTLMEDLKSHGLLESTTIVWMGEFGRTPKINPAKGRDHFAQAWSTVVAGGGIKGGQVIGKTSADGMSVEDRPVSVQDLFATIIGALGLDAHKQNMSNLGRPIRLADPEAKPIKEALA